MGSCKQELQCRRADQDPIIIDYSGLKKQTTRDAPIQSRTFALEDQYEEAAREENKTKILLYPLLPEYEKQNMPYFTPSNKTISCCLNEGYSSNIPYNSVVLQQPIRAAMSTLRSLTIPNDYLQIFARV